MIGPSTERILVFAPRGRDAELVRGILSADGLEVAICPSGSVFLQSLEEGVGCAIVTSDGLGHELCSGLEVLIAGQQPWSDYPLIVLTGSRDQNFELGNLTILERPLSPHTLLAAVHAALRARRRQYEGRAAIQQRDQFLAMLAHELRNPLAAIVLASEPLPELASVAVAAKRLAIVARQSTHLARLVNDLLDVARVSSGKVRLQREAVDIDAVIRDCVEALGPRAHERSIGFVLSPTCGAVIEGDAGRIEQVIGNLITNAIKYSPAGRTITISSAIDGAWCEIRVRDQGVGISPEMQARVFDLFAQADGSLDRSEGGMGIGLALVDWMVKLHGGTVAVTSEGLGTGSEFVVRIPIGKPPIKLTSVAPSLQSVDRPISIVLVDDNPDVLELTALFLRELGCVVETAVDGEEGLAKIVGIKPDLALVDIGLPKIDGYALAKLVRARASSVVLVAISGYGQPQDRARSLAAGFSHHLTKPVSVQRLGELIAGLRRRAERTG